MLRHFRDLWWRSKDSLGILGVYFLLFLVAFGLIFITILSVRHEHAQVIQRYDQAMAMADGEGKSLAIAYFEELYPNAEISLVSFAGLHADKLHYKIRFVDTDENSFIIIAVNPFSKKAHEWVGNL